MSKPKTPKAVEARILALRHDGMTAANIAKTTKVGESTVWRILSDAAKHNKPVVKSKPTAAADVVAPKRSALRDLHNALMPFVSRACELPGDVALELGVLTGKVSRCIDG